MNRQSMREARNRGASLVFIVIAVALISTLAAVALYSTFINREIKTVEYKGDDNFYTGEMVLEEIKAGVENATSEAYAAAYLEVMQNYNATSAGTDPTDLRQKLFAKTFRETFRKYLCGNDPSQYDTTLRTNLAGFLSTGISSVLASTKAELNGTGKNVFLDVSTSTLTDRVNSEYISNLSCVYMDQEQYVTIVSTDICVNIPELEFTNSSNLSDVVTYSIISEHGMRTQNNATFKGNLYAGSHDDGAGNIVGYDGIRITGGNVNFTNATKLISGGKLTVDGASTLCSVDGTSSLWASGVDVMGNSDKVLLLGNSYIKDDLTINGQSDEITLEGSYYGYSYDSTGTGGAEDNSSIVVNGTKTKLDMGSLNNLDLAGQAFIGLNLAKYKNNFLTEAQANSADGGASAGAATGLSGVRMGESVAVKSNQLAYLVPQECFPNGYTNPMSLAKYKTFNLSDIKLSEYGITLNIGGTEVTKYLNSGVEGVPTYKATVKPYFYRTGASEACSWVYFYLEFPTASDASKYFFDFFSSDKGNDYLSKYIGNYLKTYSTPDDTKLVLAGNMIKPNGSDYAIVGQTTYATSLDRIVQQSEYDTYAALYSSLCKNLTETFTTGEPTVFENTINKTKLRNTIDLNLLNNGYDYCVYPMGAASVADAAAVIVDNAGAAAFDIPTSSKLRVVIATGDVTLTHNFNGLIICDGKLDISGGVSVSSDVDSVSAVLIKYNDVWACFRDSSVSPTPGGTPAASEKEVDVLSLVSYQNWSKE